MSELFLGVDGGQSGTTAIIGDGDGLVLGTGHAGPSNYPGDPDAEAKFSAAIAAALHAACLHAGLDPTWQRFAGACFGLSGGPEGREAALRHIVSADRMLVSTDADIALTGALAGDPGIVVIAGTGSIAYGRNAAGRTARAGGWGYMLGDEGGAFWIARAAIRAALRFEEGWGPPTSLRALLLDATRSRGMNELMHRCYSREFTRARIASLAVFVNIAAEWGDMTAVEILSQAASELVTIARAIHGQLFGSHEMVLCSHSGGVFHSRLLRAGFREEIGKTRALQLIEPRRVPAFGAFLRAVLLKSRVSPF